MHPAGHNGRVVPGEKPSPNYSAHARQLQLEPHGDFVRNAVNLGELALPLLEIIFKLKANIRKNITTSS